MIIDYKSDLRSLARSIVIKSSHQAEVINSNIENTYGTKYVDKDYTTWRYYLNLKGEFHFTNTQEISVFITDINEYGFLTKELLEQYPKTRNELAKFGRTYLNLIKKYPSDETLIKGIISPIDMELAYTAKDGAILSYSDVLSEESDISTMKILSRYTESMYYRWFNPLYINVDKKYLATFLMFLYSTLESKIDLIRLDNIHTHNVHSYHLEQFFRSNMDIDTTYMNRKSVLWLYQNLRAVVSNAGKTESLDEVIENVLTPNGIGIGKLNILKSPVSHYTGVAFDTPTYSTKNNRLIVSPINKFYTKTEMSVNEVTTLEVEADYIHSTQYMDLGDMVDDIQEVIDTNTNLELNTKVLHLTKDDDRDILPFPRVNMVLDTLFYLNFKSDVDYTITFTDSNTDVQYIITYKQAIRLLAYLLLGSVGFESDVAIIESKSVVNDKDIDISGILIPDDSDYSYMNTLDHLRPIMETRYTDYDGIVTYIEEGIEYFTMDWVLKSSILNYTSLANLEVYDRAMHGDTITININDIADEIDLEMTDEYNYFDSIRGLVDKITNGLVVMDIHDIVVDKLKSYADMMKKLVSYNTQILDSNKASNINHIFDIGFGELVGEPVTRVKAFFNGLEPLDGNLNIAVTVDVLTNKIPTARCILPSELDSLQGMWINGRYAPYLASFDLGEHTMSNLLSTRTPDGEILKESQLQPMSGLLNYKASQLRDDYRIGDIEDYANVDVMHVADSEILKESQLQPMSGLLNYKATQLRAEFTIGDLDSYQDVDALAVPDSEIMKESQLQPMSGLLNYKATQLRGSYKMEDKETYDDASSRVFTDNDILLGIKLTVMDGAITNTKTAQPTNYRMSTNDILNITHKESTDNRAIGKSKLHTKVGSIDSDRYTLELED